MVNHDYIAVLNEYDSLGGETDWGKGFGDIAELSRLREQLAMYLVEMSSEDIIESIYYMLEERRAAKNVTDE